MSAHAQQWSRGRAELWTRSSSAVGWPRVQTSILIVAEAFLRRSSPVGTVLGDSSRQSVFRPEPGRGHLGESPRGGGEFSAACNHTSMQGERKWCSLAKDPAPPLLPPPPRLLRAARDIDACVLNPSALPFSKESYPLPAQTLTMVSVRSSQRTTALKKRRSLSTASLPECSQACVQGISSATKCEPP